MSDDTEGFDWFDDTFNMFLETTVPVAERLCRSALNGKITPMQAYILMSAYEKLPDDERELLAKTCHCRGSVGGQWFDRLHDAITRHGIAIITEMTHADRRNKLGMYALRRYQTDDIDVHDACDCLAMFAGMNERELEDSLAYMKYIVIRDFEYLGDLDFCCAWAAMRRGKAKDG